MVKRLIPIILLATAAISYAAATRYYYDRPLQPTIADNDRLLFYNWTGNTRDRNILGSALKTQFIARDTTDITIGNAAHNATSSDSISFGANAGSNTWGTYNVAIGRSALSNAGSTVTNTFGLGAYALRNLTIGSGNVGIGFQAGDQIASGADNTKSRSSIFIGGYSKASVYDGLNEIVIGTNAIGAGSNTATIGDSSLTTLYSGQTGTATVTTAGLTANTSTKINIGSASTYDDAQTRLGIGTQSPSFTFSAYSSARPRSERRIHTGTTTNGAYLDAYMGIRFKGTSVNYLDVEYPMAPPKATGAGNPTLVTYAENTMLKGYSFAVNDIHYFDAKEYPHNGLIGGSITWHVHWDNQTNVAATRGVKWEITRTCCLANGTCPAATTSSADITVSASTAVGKQYLSDIVTDTYANIGPGSACIASLKRIASANTAPATDPIVIGLHYHYSVDSLGSDGVTSKTP